VDSFTLEGKLCFKGAIEAFKALPELFFHWSIVLPFLRTAFLNRASLFSNIAPCCAACTFCMLYHRCAVHYNIKIRF
jgi:hypothetical protein